MSNFIYAKGAGDFDPPWSDEEDGPVNVEYWSAQATRELFRVIDLGVWTESESDKAIDLLEGQNWAAVQAMAKSLLCRSDLSTEERKIVEALDNSADCLKPDLYMSRRR